jgi:GGDEF domain-containing protein
MTGQRTATFLRVTEQKKARARLLLLTLIGLVCPPLAGVRSAPVWIFYLAFLVLYSFWSLRLVRNFSGDRRLGYLLSLTDAAILLPLMAWSSAVALRAVLLVACGIGLAFTYWADRTRDRSAGRSGRDSDAPRSRAIANRSEGERMDTPLERALRVRLAILGRSETRFALVVLRLLRFEEMASYYGEEESHRLLSAVSRRGLRLLNPDAQDFELPGGRVAFVFATGDGRMRVAPQEEEAFGWIDPYDVEGFAMALGRKVCEHLIDGHRVECVVGWASAPADGMSADDLMYTAESGAQSAAAFRRVAGSRVPVPEKSRVAAG